MEGTKKDVSELSINDLKALILDNQDIAQGCKQQAQICRQEIAKRQVEAQTQTEDADDPGADRRKFLKKVEDMDGGCRPAERG